MTALKNSLLILTGVLVASQLSCGSGGGGTKASSADPVQLTPAQYSTLTTVSSATATANQSAYNGTTIGYWDKAMKKTVALALHQRKFSETQTIDETLNPNNTPYSCTGGGTVLATGKVTGTVESSETSAKINIKLQSLKTAMDDCTETQDGETATVNGDITASGTFDITGNSDSGSIKFSISMDADLSATVDSETHTLKIDGFKMSLNLSQKDIAELSELSTDDNGAQAKQFFFEHVEYSGNICVDKGTANEVCGSTASWMKCVTDTDADVIAQCKSKTAK